MNLTAAFLTPRTAHTAVWWAAAPNWSVWHPDLCCRAAPSGTRELTGTSNIILQLKSHRVPKRIWSDKLALSELSSDKQQYKRCRGWIRTTHVTQGNQFLWSRAAESGLSGTGPRGSVESRKEVVGLRWQVCCGTAGEGSLTYPAGCVWLEYESQLQNKVFASWFQHWQELQQPGSNKEARKNLNNLLGLEAKTRRNEITSL